MGWWKLNGTENYVGDGPLDALDDAVIAIVTEYQNEFGRKPMKAEWEALLHRALGNEMSEFWCMEEGAAQKVSIEVK